MYVKVQNSSNQETAKEQQSLEMGGLHYQLGGLHYQLSKLIKI